jgi:hypothetical protein
MLVLKDQLPDPADQKQPEQDQGEEVIVNPPAGWA